MNLFKKIWFWFLIMSILLLIVTIVLFEVNKFYVDSDVPWWMWVLFILTILMFIIAVVLYIIDVMAYKKKLAIDEACGNLPPPPIKPKIVCPEKPQCKETNISMYTKTNISPKPEVTTFDLPTVTPVVSPMPVPNYTQIQNQIPNQIPNQMVLPNQIPNQMVLPNQNNVLANATPVSNNLIKFINTPNTLPTMNYATPKLPNPV